MHTGQTLDRRRPTGPRGLLARLAQLDDRAADRAIRRLGLLLLIGTVAVVAFYVLDRRVDTGPALAERAVAAAEAKVRTDPNDVNARLGLAGAYEAVGRTEDAAAQYGEVLAAVPDSRLGLLGRGRMRVALGDLAGAKADLGAIVAGAASGEMAGSDPQLEAAYYHLGSIALTEGDPRTAIDLLGRALRINRTDADALYLVGKAFLATGAPDDAITALRKAVALVPMGWCEPYGELATAYDAAADPTGAAYARGMDAVCGGRADEARDLLTPLTTGALAVDAKVGLGLLAESEADLGAAAEWFRQALADDPVNFQAAQGLARATTTPVSAAHGTAAGE